MLSHTILFTNLFTYPKKYYNNKKVHVLGIRDFFNAFYLKLNFQVSIQSDGFPHGILMHVCHSTFLCSHPPHPCLLPAGSLSVPFRTRLCFPIQVLSCFLFKLSFSCTHVDTCLGVHTYIYIHTLPIDM